MFSLLTLLDDVATTLDDVSVMTKVAMKKTSALMSDDLAVNAGVIDGVHTDRELPMVKAIFIGSLYNKVYCIIGVLLLMAFYPPLLKVILLCGGVYLAYEGGHKLLEKLYHKPKKEQYPVKVMNEKAKIKGAVRTDLILSIEIIVIAKSAVTGSFWQQTITLVIVGLIASILIYGLVALIVKIDDLGLYLIRKKWLRTGRSLVSSMPYTMKGLGVVGTVAMFLVAGGIFNHTFHLPLVLPELAQNLVLGLIVGLLCTVVFEQVKKVSPLNN